MPERFVNPLSSLVDDLQGARSFEEAADHCLKAVLERCLPELNPQARLIRAVVHLRPGGGGYAGLRAMAVPPADAKGDMAPSLSAWRYLTELRIPVALDVRLGTVEGTTLGDAAAPDLSQETVHRLLSRDATHVLGIPLRGPRGVLHGMVSIEAECMAAIGEEGFWAELPKSLGLLVDLSTPYLVALPGNVQAKRRDDALLPVVGASLSPLMDLLETFAQVDETLLISGATGTGKSRLARWCHAQSPRTEAPFEHLDLLSVPADMQLPELFGWKRGAFTGAHQDRKGAIERAEGGTLFLDEIDKLSLAAQAGLLQLLETRTYRRLGDSGSQRQANVRFLVGTNQDLGEQVASGAFREDLYYRINVLPVHLPSLDERKDEIGAWAEYMLARRHKESGGKGVAVLAQDAVAALEHMHWPGNLRQLDNVIRRAYAVALVANPKAVDRVVDGAAVERALGLERPAPGAIPAELGPLMAKSAVLLLDAMQGKTPDLEHYRVLRAFILAEATRRQGGVKEAFLWFGRDKTVQGRNHMRDYKAALAEVEAMEQDLGLDLGLDAP